MRISDWSSDVCSSDLGRQEEELCAGVSDGAADLLALVTAEIIEDDEIARLEGGDQELLDVGLELLAVDRAIEEAGCLDAIMPQGGQEGERAPAAVRRLADPPGHVRAVLPSLEGGFFEAEPLGVQERPHRLLAHLATARRQHEIGRAQVRTPDTNAQTVCR